MVRNQRGQVTAETAVLFTFVIAGFVFMGVYLQRAAQGGVKSNADSLGQQFSTTSGFASYSEQESKTSTTGLTLSANCSDYAANVGGGAPAGIAACSKPKPELPTGLDE